MSRIGKMPIDIPDGVDVQIKERELCVSGTKGKLAMPLPAGFDVDVKDKKIFIAPKVATDESNALHGLYRTMIANMVIGVTKGYAKQLEIQGVGFKAAVQGRKMVLNLGFSHPIEMAVPEGIEVKVADSVNISVAGPDKQLVGDFSARIKALFPAEPYKGKGVRFKGEYVRRKVGKTVA